MQVEEVLRRYAEGERDFRGVNLRGQSFTGQELTGADFSGADIRGTSFSRAKLRQVNFSCVTAGLTRFWSLSVICLAWVLSGFSGIFAGFAASMSALISDATNIENITTGWIALIVTIIFFTLSIYKGVSIGFVSVSILSALFVTIAFALDFAVSHIDAFSIVLGFAGAFTSSVVLTVAFAVTFAAVRNVGRVFACLGTLLVVGVVVIAIAGPQAQVFAFSEALKGPVAFTLVFVVARFMTLASAYIGARAFAGDERDAFIGTLALAGAALKGTSFRGADLTHANFTHAVCKHTDYRNAILQCTGWHQAKQLSSARLNGTYLHDAKVRQLAMTRHGQNTNFDRADLRGINLQGAYLHAASFMDADLSQAHLQDAHLCEATFVRTNLDMANFEGACLTGACIEDWGITRRTQFDGVRCRYVYLRLLTEHNREPHRMPPLEQGDFDDHDFHIFLTSVLDTLDLYHKQNINAGVAVTVLKGLTNAYHIRFELVGLEKRGNDQFLIRLKVFGHASHSQLQREYYARYEQTLPLYDPHRLLSHTDQALKEMIEKAMKQNPGTTHIGHVYNQGVLITGGSVNMTADQHHSITIGDIGGDFHASGAALNLGEIRDTLKLTIDALPDTPHSNHPGIKDLLIQLHTAIANEPGLSDADKADALEQVKELAGAGHNPNENANKTLAKRSLRMLKGLVTELPKATVLVKEMNRLLPAIGKLFEA